MSANALAPINAAPTTYTLDEVQKMAQAIYSGGLFADFKTPQAVLTLMLLCQAEGMHPMMAVRRYHLINGKPSMRADAMLATFQQAGGKVRWGDRSNTVVSAVFSHPLSGETEIVWTFDDAKRAGLPEKNPNWHKYPRQMLTARVISEGVRATLPGVCMGLYTPEEVEDFDTKPEPRPRAQRAPQTYDQIDAQVEANGGRGKVHRAIEPAKTLSETGEAITAPQLKALGAMGYPGSAEGFPSRTTMTKAQASQIIDYFNRHKTWEGAPGDPGTSTEANETDELTDPFAGEEN